MPQSLLAARRVNPLHDEHFATFDAQTLNGI